MKLTRMTLAMALVFTVCGGALAIEPTHYGQYGNPEEPATRPYKAFWRGLKAIPYQVCNSAERGEEKAGTFGNLEAFRGLRRGVVEFGDSSWWGMAGTYPPPVEHFSASNEWIEQDRRLAALCDLPTTVGVFALASGSNALAMMFGAAAVTVSQSEIDRQAMSPEQLEANKAVARETRAQDWPSNTINRNDQRPQGLKFAGPLKMKAETKNLDEDSPIMDTPYSGDMISKARRGKIVED